MSLPLVYDLGYGIFRSEVFGAAICARVISKVVVVVVSFFCICLPYLDFGPSERIQS